MKKVSSFFCTLIFCFGLHSSLVGYELDDSDIADEYVESEEKEKEPEEVSSERVALLQKTAKNMPIILAEIEQKIASSRQLEGLFLPWQSTFDDLKQISFLLQDELYAEAASRKKFDSFYQLFQALTVRLSAMDQQFVVPEFRLQTEDIRFLLGVTPGATEDEIVETYQKRLKQALQQIEDLQADSDHQVKAQEEIEKLKTNVSLLMQAYGIFLLQKKAQSITKIIIDQLAALKDKGFFDDFKGIEKLYEESAAKVKKEKEAKEEEARAEQESTDDWWSYFDWDF